MSLAGMQVQASTRCTCNTCRMKASRRIAARISANSGIHARQYGGVIRRSSTIATSNGIPGPATSKRRTTAGTICPCIRIMTAASFDELAVLRRRCTLATRRPQTMMDAVSLTRSGRRSTTARASRSAAGKSESREVLRNNITSAALCLF